MSNVQDTLAGATIDDAEVERAGAFIAAKYDKVEVVSGVLGGAAGAVLACRDGEGFCRHFDYGSIYWHPATGACETHGAIRDKYFALGAEASFLGYPTTDETSTPDGVGRYNHFQAGSIYWTPATWACEVHGRIRDHWSSHGWERNPALGYPISDELTPDAAPAVQQDSTAALAYQSRANRFSDFENGVVFWPRGSDGAYQLAPWATDGSADKHSLTANDVLASIEPIVTALRTMPNSVVLSVTFAGVTDYSFDGVGVHNRRHRFQVGMQQFVRISSLLPIPIPVWVAIELQVEVALEPVLRRILGYLTEWTFPSTGQDKGTRAQIAEQLHLTLDPLLWTHFDVLTLDARPEDGRATILSAKTMTNGDVNLFVEPIVASRAPQPVTDASSGPPAESPPDGTLLGDTSGAIYVVYGGAKFYIPTMQILAALGLDDNIVQWSGDALLAVLPTVPRSGTVLKEQSDPAVYVMLNEERCWVPDEETLAGYGGWAAMRVVPDGALSSIRVGARAPSR